MTVFEMNNAINEALKPKIDKYAIYLRKSRADIEAEKDGEGETLARHRKILTDLAVRKGLYIEKIYEEIVSGETIEARQEIQKLIQDCYAGKYRGIIVIDISRLSRGNQGDAQTILDCLKFSNTNRGVLVVTPSKTYDIANNHDDEEYMEFELFMSRREYKMIKRRLDRGKIQSVVEGNYMGAVRPYGYNIVKTKRSRYLEFNDDEAPYVKMMYEWALHENLTPGGIAARLNAMGVESYGKLGWNVGTVRNMLSNSVYIGKVKWFERVKVKSMIGNEIETRMVRYTDQYVEYDGKHKGIIDEETFKAVAARFPSDRTRNKLTLVNPLAGILRCAKCGKNMRYKKYDDSRLRYIHPTTHDRCRVKGAVVDDVFNATKYALKLHIENFELKLDNNSVIDRNSTETQLNALRNELKRVEQKKARLFDGWEDGKITDNEFVERKAILSDHVDTIKRQMEELENVIPEQEEFQEKIITIHQTLDMLADPDIDAKTKNEYLKKLINTVNFSRENDHEFILDVILN